jgi:uncharacterized membrane protein YbhN (UPF0104 family)
MPYLALALFLYLVGVVVCARRWQVLLHGCDVQISLASATALYFVGNFFNNILPGSVSGDIVKMYQLSRHCDRSEVAVASVLIDRVAGLLVLVAIAATAVPFSRDLVPWHMSVIVVGAAVGMWGGVWLLSRDRLWHGLRSRSGLLRRLAGWGRLRRLYRAMRLIRRRATAEALVLSLVFDILWIAVRYLIALALGLHLSIWYFLIFIPIISLITLVPVSFSGLGVREGAYVYLFSQVGVEAPLALSMSLAFYVIRVIGGIIGGIVYGLGSRTYLGKPKDRTESPSTRPELGATDSGSEIGGA